LVGVGAGVALAFVTRLAAVFLAAGLAFVDRVAVLGVAFLAAPAFAPQQPFIDRVAVVFAAAGFAVPRAFVDRFALAFVAVVVLAAFEFVAINHGSSSEDVLFLIRLHSRHPDVSRYQPINLACEASNPHTRIAHECVRSANHLSCNGLATIIGHLHDPPNSRN
jgi:di/tricarboxylate transporter